MNVYDFDKTIYKGDSTRDFYFYTLRKKPSVLKYLPMQAFYFVKFISGRITKTQFKEKFYMFFDVIEDIDAFVDSFWNSHKKNIKSWYYEKHKDSDYIISASPEFLLKPICQYLKVTNLIASKVDKYTGKYDGLNCYGEEKVKRLRLITNERIEEFYSDSRSDTPLAEIAGKAFIVKGAKIDGWE